MKVNRSEYIEFVGAGDRRGVKDDRAVVYGIVERGLGWTDVIVYGLILVGLVAGVVGLVL